MCKSSEPIRLSNGDSERMLEMSIRQFVQLTDGKLVMSQMPPLGGELEPIGRIVPVSGNYERGDVVWVDEDKSVCLESMQLQGAMGVVAQRVAAPIANCFSVCVPDMQKALQQVAEFCRDRYLGRLVVAIVPESDSEDLCWQLINMNQASTMSVMKLSINAARQLRWCDADEVLIDGRLSDDQRNFVVTYLPTNAPIRLAS